MGTYIHTNAEYVITIWLRKQWQWLFYVTAAMYIPVARNCDCLIKHSVYMHECACSLLYLSIIDGTSQNTIGETATLESTTRIINLQILPVDCV